MRCTGIILYACGGDLGPIQMFALHFFDTTENSKILHSIITTWGYKHLVFSTQNPCCGSEPTLFGPWIQIRILSPFESGSCSGAKQDPSKFRPNLNFTNFRKIEVFTVVKMLILGLRLSCQVIFKSINFKLFIQIFKVLHHASSLERHF